MSALYNLEPQPTAKVILNTTAGDIELELFAKQIPIASRNFLQLCLDGCYDGTIFHRLIPGFIIQGGDPTGTGSGGESGLEDGKPFEDEFHSRLRFNRRGLLGMANWGKDDNGSQFFLTLSETPELQGKNTMFGRVVGDTIYNLVKMSEGELADKEGDRPLYPYKITKTEILVNPFEDMAKRDLIKRAVALPVKKDKKKPKRKAGKGLLSFGCDAEEDDIAPVTKKPKFNAKLVSAGEDSAKRNIDLSAPEPSLSKKQRLIPMPRRSISPTLPKREQILSTLSNLPAKVARPPPSASNSESDLDSMFGNEHRNKMSDVISKTNAQIHDLKASMQRRAPLHAPIEKKKTVLDAMIPETSTKGRKRKPEGTGKEDPDVMEMFKAFKNKLQSIPTNKQDGIPAAQVKAQVEVDNGKGNTITEDEAELCDLHFIADCQSCTKWDQRKGKEEEEELAGSAWLSHKLSFAKDRLGKDLEWKRKNEEELVVIDPREKTKDLGLNKSSKRNSRDEGRRHDKVKHK